MVVAAKSHHFVPPPSSWRGRGGCQGRFLCTRLDGNVCGDYGIGISHIAEDATSEKATNKFFFLTSVLLFETALAVSSTSDLCYANQVVPVHLRADEEMKVEYWWMRQEEEERGEGGGGGIPDQVQCHFWCNSRGDLPTALPASNVGSDFMESLVGMTIMSV